MADGYNEHIDYGSCRALSPDDERREIDRLEFIELIDTRIAKANAGGVTYTQAEVERRVGYWLMRRRVENDT